MRRQWPALIAVVALACATSPLPAAEILSLAVHPAKVALRGRDDSRQLIVTATLTGGKLQDLSGDVAYETAGKVVRVTSTGRVIPLADGDTSITVRHGGRTVTVPVSAEAVDVDLPINFGNQIVPIFTQLGCNAGNCHGKASGQNGFKLSLLGLEPEADYDALVKEARGRRILPAAPGHSLMLRKPTGQAPHGGGRRLDPQSDEYKLLRRWIAAGSPFGGRDDPVVTRISVYPERRIMTPAGRQQLALLAHYSNGSAVDVTRRAQYQSNDPEIAKVDPAGLVRALAGGGEAAVMARYQGHVATFRAVVPREAKTPDYRFEAKTLVDRFTLVKWRQLNIMPSDLCGDGEFLRRASLDITGTLPSAEQVRQFLADKAPDKRDRLVDALLKTPAYGYFFANKWASILKVRTGGTGKGTEYKARGTTAFHKWIVEAMAADMPYDRFVRAIVAATGDERDHPPALWYKNRAEYPRAVGRDTELALERPAQFVDEVGQLFLGQRLACAQCHHHPYEKWSQDDYWGMAAYFGRFGRKYVEGPGLPKIVRSRAQQVNPQAIFVLPAGDVINPRTRKPAFMKPLDGLIVSVPAKEDPRERLVDWMVDAKNPFFARAVANRYWSHFLGRGLVEPIDDMRETNPPTNPELLDALAADLIKHKYSLKHLIRTICKSRTYQLSSTPNDLNKQDKQTYARYYPRRMIAEVLFDAVGQVTDSPTVFETRAPLPPRRVARAIMLPDDTFGFSYFLDVFGRPDRVTACECERSSEATLAQVLHLLNSNEVQDRIARAGGRADRLARDARPDVEKVEELFLWLYGRKPSPAQLKLALADIADNATNKRLAYENILWALLNTKEFLFNH